jgi:1,4-dihydroxy-2-naphthoate polyprenyltransferase
MAAKSMKRAIWREALSVIPGISREEWNGLGLLSRWLVSSRTAVLVMTFVSSAAAGLLAFRDGVVRPVAWLIMTAGLMLGHAVNNLLNDYTDFRRGVDTDNYARTQYGPQTVAQGLLTPRQILGFAAVTGAFVLAAAFSLFVMDGLDPIVLVLLGAASAFVLFYTWPLKYVAMGELSVFLVWGPIMIGGGYYVLTRHFDANVLLAGAPYALCVTTVIFGKHIDKIDLDRGKRITTLPVLIGEKAARYSIIAMTGIAFVVTLALIALRYFTPAMAVVLLALPALLKTLPALSRPRPAERPEGFPEGRGGWPLYFAPIAFVSTRAFGGWYLLGLCAEAALRHFLPAFWR